MDLFRIYVLWLSIFRIIWYINNTIHNSKIVHDTLIFSILNIVPIKYIISILLRVFFVIVWYFSLTHNIYFTIWVYKNINIFLDINIIIYSLVYFMVPIRANFFHDKIHWFYSLVNFQSIYTYLLKYVW